MTTSRSATIRAASLFVRGHKISGSNSPTLLFLPNCVLKGIAMTKLKLLASSAFASIAVVAIGVSLALAQLALAQNEKPAGPATPPMQVDPQRAVVKDLPGAKAQAAEP